jgi:hypothetical protein
MAVTQRRIIQNKKAAQLARPSILFQAEFLGASRRNRSAGSA